MGNIKGKGLWNIEPLLVNSNEKRSDKTNDKREPEGSS